MARDFDNFPTYDPIIRPHSTYLSPIWADFIATFVESLQGYLSQNGIFIPQITTSERDALQNPLEGQMIYNTTIIAPQVYQNGAWKTFTTS